jgi:hypothetical protein
MVMIACTASEAGGPARAEPQDAGRNAVLHVLEQTHYFPETGPILLDYFGLGDEFVACPPGATGKSTPPPAARR